MFAVLDSCGNYPGDLTPPGATSRLKMQGSPKRDPGTNPGSRWSRTSGLFAAVLLKVALYQGVSRSPYTSDGGKELGYGQ